MQRPNLTHDEPQRLQILRSINVLDTLPEERFDRLTRMAKRIFDVPIAVVSLVDENRVWFKSCIGLGTSESPRDDSFCGHTILGRDVLIIPNALDDPRFADNPYVLNDPKFRFYAGCPVTVNGSLLGTLCVIDQKPRNFDATDIEALRDLASMVERELAIVQIATIDELTNISNRRGFIVMAQQILNLCSRQKISAALVFLDLDKFKPINDRFGHEEGDRALTSFANQMKQSFRSSDITARLGGDEFVVLLTNTSKQQAEALIEKFTSNVRKGNQEAGRGYNISFSHGIVEFNPDKHFDIKALLADSDSLMFDAKTEKRIFSTNTYFSHSEIT
jgi:diguanylate cyclase (GGDEF)-like protein